MSWSRSYSGSPADVVRAAREDKAAIEDSLPEFERDQVLPVIEALNNMSVALPDTARLTVSLSGHGWQNADGSGGGGLSVSVSFELPAA